MSASASPIANTASLMPQYADFSDWPNSRDWLAHLVSFNTVSRESNLALIQCLRDALGVVGVSAEVIHNDGGDKANLLAVIGPEVEGGVVLSGHTDVVPVEGQAWDSDPFTLREAEGRLHGRGSADMKGFIACCMAAVPALVNAQRAGTLKKPVILAFSYDEEIGCLGAPRMIARLRDRLPRPAAVLVGEPTMMAIVDAHKGITDLRTTVTGKPSHSSLVYQGVSAIHLAARMVTFIEDRMQARIDCGHLDERFDVPHASLHVGRCVICRARMSRRCWRRSMPTPSVWSPPIVSGRQKWRFVANARWKRCRHWGMAIGIRPFASASVCWAMSGPARPWRTPPRRDSSRAKAGRRWSAGQAPSGSRIRPTSTSSSASWRPVIASWPSWCVSNRAAEALVLGLLR